MSQTLYLGGGGAKGGAASGGGGSLSSRFQKLSQSRSGGITIVSAGGRGLESRPGRALGLGQNTGVRSSGAGGQRITTGQQQTRGGGRGAAAVAAGGRGGGRGTISGGIHTASGLAREMQERGGGVTDEFMLAPAVYLARKGEVATGGRGDHSVTRGRGGRGGPIRGAGSDRSSHQNQQRQQLTNTRANSHKALALGHRPGKKQQQQQQGGANARAAQQTQARAGGAKNGGNKKQGGAAQPSGEKGKHGKKGKKEPLDAASLDSELTAYMMKDPQAAASALDNDLDSYMADKPADGEFTW